MCDGLRNMSAYSSYQLSCFILVMTDVEMSPGSTVGATPQRSAKRKRKSLLRQSLLNNTLNSSVIDENGSFSPASKQSRENAETSQKQQQMRRSLRAGDVLSSSQVPNKEQLEVMARPNMDIEQVVNHYQSCVQAANSGKLNAKNAFSLHLIDMMAEVLQSCNKEQFFQTAGCTIDVGAKIYSYRVDGLHTDAYRVANILGGGKSKEDDENAGDNADADVESEIPLRLKKRKKNFKCIVEDTSKIFKHVVYNVEHDAIRKTAGSLIDTTNNAIVCLNLPLEEGEDRKERIVTDGREKMSAFRTTYTDASTFPLISRENLCLPDIDEVKSKILCPPIDEVYRFFNDSVMNRTQDTINDSRMDKFLMDVQDNFAFDPDAPPAPDNAFDDQEYSINFDQDENIGSVSRAEEAFAAVPPGNDSAIAPGTGREFDVLGETQFSNIEPSLENLLKFIQPGDFTNFSEPVLNAFFGTRAKANSREAGSKVVKKKTKISPNTILVEFKSKAALASQKSTAATTLSDKTIDKNKRTCAAYSRVEFPREKWSLFFEAKLDFAKSRKKGKKVQNEVEIELEEGYDYQNALDKSNLVHALRDDDYKDDDPANDNRDNDDEPEFFNANGDDFDIDEFANDDADNHSDDNALVEQPVYAQQFKLNYSKRAKTVDVRKLKHSMLTALIKNRPSETDQDSKKPLELTDLYSRAKSSLPEKAIADLSIPIAFVALLDLANEKNLQLSTLREGTNVCAIFAEDAITVS